MQKPICCICHNETLNNRFSCLRCKEGTICEECWDNESLNTSKCPVCRFSTTDDIWYNMEEGIINDEEILTENEIQINLRRRREESIKAKSRFWAGIIFLIFCLLCTIIGTIFRGFIINHDYYTCYFNCKDKNGKKIDNATTIGESFVIGLVVIVGIISFILVSMLICAFCNCLLSIVKDNLVKIQTELDNRFNFTEKATKILRYTLMLTAFLLISFIVGFLFNYFNGFCNWNCPNITNVWTITITIMVGGFITLIFVLSLTLIISCVSGCTIACLEIGTSNE